MTFLHALRLTVLGCPALWAVSAIAADPTPPPPAAAQTTTTAVAPTPEERVAAIEAGLGDWQILHDESGPGGIVLKLARSQNRESVYQLTINDEAGNWTVEDYLDFRGRPVFVRVVKGPPSPQSAANSPAPAAPGHPGAVEWRLFFQGGTMTALERRFAPQAGDCFAPKEGDLSAESFAVSPVTTYTQPDFATEPNDWPLIHEIPLRVRLLAEQRNDYHQRTLTDMLVALPHPEPGPAPETTTDAQAPPASGH